MCLIHDGTEERALMCRVQIMISCLRKETNSQKATEKI